jgi:hypothetical protein
MLTIQEFEKIPHGKVFATGVLPNSPEGIFMTTDEGNLRWVAKKGYGYDWAIYCHWEDKTVEWITQYGDKVHGKSHIQRCVSCDDQVIALYRS